MSLQMSVAYGISDFFVILCMTIFTKRRYSRGVTAAAMTAVYLAMIFLEILRYRMSGRGYTWRFTLIIMAVICLGAELALSEYRDSRAVCAAFMAGSYSMFGFMVMKILFALNTAPAVMIAAGIAAHIGLLSVLVRFLLPPFRRLQSVYRTEWKLLGVILAMFCGGMYLFYACLKGPDVTMLLRLTPLVYLACTYFLVILVFQMLDMLSEKEMEDREQKVLQARMGALKREVDELHRAEERIAQYNHDSRHFVRMLRGMMAERDYRGVEGALAEMQSMSAVTRTEQYCGNLPLNGMVSYYVRMAEEHKIGLTVNLRELPEDLGEDGWELATVIGNLLDNAVQAGAGVEPAESRKLQVCGREIGGQALFEIRNTYSGTIDFDRQTRLPVSHKGEGHGFGMRSVANFVERRGGTLDCGVEGEWFYVRLLV